MEVASATLTGGCSLPLRTPTAASRNYLPCPSFFRYSSRRPPFSCFKFKGYYLLVNPVRLQRSSLADVGETTAVPNDRTEEQVSFFDMSDTSSNHGDADGKLTKNSATIDRNDDVEVLDDHKMIRVCDKLIDVFMVDKPTPTDWRSLLAFSKEWNNIWPHFDKHCQDRADSEEDPGMKHKLLWLGRKLKEVDEDVQRHNELLEVIKGGTI